MPLYIYSNMESDVISLPQISITIPGKSVAISEIENMNCALCRAKKLEKIWDR